MEYQVIFIIKGKRERLVLEHVKEEYGVSPASFWTCWIVANKAINGEGETAEEAIQDMIKTKTMCDNMREQFHKSIGENPVFQTPIIGNELPVPGQMVDIYMNAAISSYRQQRRLLRVL